MSVALNQDKCLAALILTRSVSKAHKTLNFNPQRKRGTQNFGLKKAVLLGLLITDYYDSKGCEFPMSQLRTSLTALLLAVSSSTVSFAQAPLAKTAPAKKPTAVTPATKAPATSGTRAGAKPTASAMPPKTSSIAPAKEPLKLNVPSVGKPAEIKVTADESDAPTAVSTAAKPRLEKLNLNYRFAKGETLRSRVTQQTRVETSIGGSTQIAEMASVSVKRWLVKNVDKDGNVTFETQWDSIDMRQKMSGREEVRYNSVTDKSAPAGYDQIAAMIGRPLSLITIDPRGKIIRREAKDAETQKTLASSTYQAEQQLLVPLPGEAVTLGQPWSVPTDIRVSLDDNKSTRTIQARHRYEVEKIEGDIAVIGHETILPPLSDPEIRSQVIQQLGRGTVRFDLKTGKVLEQTSEVDERVIGFRGAESSIHFLSKFTEELLPAAPPSKSTAGSKPAVTGKQTPANTATKLASQPAKK